MALTSTTYNFDIELSDSDRGVYETLRCTVARHPSESIDYLVTRVLAYCMEYEDGLVFTKGLSDADEPALWSKSLDGRILKWIEVGAPSGERLHRAAKAARTVSVYTYKPAAVVLGNLGGRRIHNGERIVLRSFGAPFVHALGETLERRTKMTVSVSGGELFVESGGRTLTGVVEEHMLG